MNTASQTLVDLEKRFWQSMIDEDTDTALEMLAEPSLMVSPHGAMKFDHAAYREMAEKGSMVIKSYELDDMDVLFANDDTAVLTYKVRQTIAPRGKGKASAKEVTQEMADSSTWVRQDGHWRCVMHTETPVDKTSH